MANVWYVFEHVRAIVCLFRNSFACNTFTTFNVLQKTVIEEQLILQHSEIKINISQREWNISHSVDEKPRSYLLYVKTLCFN